MAGIQKYNFFSNTYIFARGGVYIHWEFHFPPRLQTFVETPVLVLIEISSFQAVFSIVNGYFEISSFQVARGCLCLGTEIANSPCSWCAGNMSPPRLPPGDRRHLLPGRCISHNKVKAF
jgi:hypothetical protein